MLLRSHIFLMILFYCGLRRSEVCQLSFDQVGFEKNTRFFKFRGKGNAERIVVMVPAVFHALEYYLRICNKQPQSGEFIFTPRKNNRTKDHKKPLDPSSIFYVVRKYAKKAGITKKVGPHSCRATAISRLSPRLALRMPVRRSTSMVTALRRWWRRPLTPKP